MYPDELHYEYVRRCCRDWFPGQSETEVRQAVYLETERLRGFYRAMLKVRSPYRDAWRGYVAAYMPRGYFWLASIVGRHRRLRSVVHNAASILVVGCGPAPELWSLSRFVGGSAVLTLVDQEMDIWRPVIEDFTVPLVEQTRGGLVFDRCLDLEFRRGGHGSVPGQYDVIVAQQVFNEIAARPVPALPGGPLTPLSTVTAWQARAVRPGGAIVVVDNDPDSRRLAGVERELPRGASEFGSLRNAVVRRSEDLHRWLSGPWGAPPRRSRAATKYLIVYC